MTMIKCLEIYDNSDSIRQEIEFQCLPNVGDSLFINDNENVITKISHVISLGSDPHAVRIHYVTKP